MPERVFFLALQHDTLWKTSRTRFSLSLRAEGRGGEEESSQLPDYTPFTHTCLRRNKMALLPTFKGPPTRKNKAGCKLRKREGAGGGAEPGTAAWGISIFPPGQKNNVQCPAVGRAFWWMFHLLVMSETFLACFFFLFLFKGGKWQTVKSGTQQKSHW